MNADFNKELKAQANAFRKTIEKIALIFGLIVFVLGGWVFYDSKHNVRTQLMPPVLTGAMTLGHNYVDEGYLSQTAEYLLYLRFNVQPETAQKNFGRFLKFLTPESYAHVRPILAKEVKTIKKDHIASSVFIKKLGVEPKELLVEVTLLHSKWVGERALPKETKKYRMQFEYMGGGVFLDSITAVVNE